MYVLLGLWPLSRPPWDVPRTPAHTLCAHPTGEDRAPWGGGSLTEGEHERVFSKDRFSLRTWLCGALAFCTAQTKQTCEQCGGGVNLPGPGEAVWTVQHLK